MSLGLLSPPIPSFSGIRKVKDILLNHSMKCYNSVRNAETQHFNAQQGSRVIIVVGPVGAVKIYVAAVEALSQKGKTGWNSVYHRNWCFSSFPPLNANVLSCKFFLNLTLCMTKLKVLVLCLSSFPDNSIVSQHKEPQKHFQSPFWTSPKIAN